MAPPVGFHPPAGVDVCLGPVGYCMGEGRWADGCAVLNFTKGAPVAGVHDPLQVIGHRWVRAASRGGRTIKQ